MTSTELPPPPQEFAGKIGKTYLESDPFWQERPLPPKDAPNVIVIVMDDLGFGQLSCFGGPIEAPNIAKLAGAGLRFNNFHTTALCSPTRASLLTGRNHHSVGFACIAELSTGYPGYNSFLPKSAATLAEVLRQNGYATLCAGKWHLTPSHESTPAGPFDHWPLGMGFERFYGFMPGQVGQWHPMLTADNRRVPTPEREGYHFSEDVVDQAIGMIRDHDQANTGRKFFLYLAFGAPHAPFHAPKSYIEKYRGQFDDGWDGLRQRTYERQKAMGIIPPNTDLAPRDPGIPSWQSVDDKAKPLYCRLMETFAGMVDHADTQIGRLMEELHHLGIQEDTLIVFLSDNGASGEGGIHGTLNTDRMRSHVLMTVEEMLPQLDQIGAAGTDPHYPAGWAMAGNAPFRRYKRDTHRGGNTDPFIVHWPGHFGEGGAIRNQYIHVADIYPTILDLCHITIPDRVNGVAQKPVEGVSFARALFSTDAGETRRTQYYEMLGSRAIWHEGWTAVTWHKPGTDWKDDVWELYDLGTDYSQAHDLAKQHPQKLNELVDLWWKEAQAHQVLPLDDRHAGRYLDPTRPRASLPREVYRFHPGTAPIPNQALPTFVNCPHGFTAYLRLERPDDGGLVVAQGGNLGGWAVLIADGCALYVHNYLGMKIITLKTGKLPLGLDLRLTLEWIPEAFGKGTARLLVNGQEQVREEGVVTSIGGPSPVQEGLQIGRSWGPSISPDHYQGSSPFTGTLVRVELRTNPAGRPLPTPAVLAMLRG